MKKDKNILHLFFFSDYVTRNIRQAPKYVQLEISK